MEAKRKDEEKAGFVAPHAAQQRRIMKIQEAKKAHDQATMAQMVDAETQTRLMGPIPVGVFLRTFLLGLFRWCVSRFTSAAFQSMQQEDPTMQNLRRAGNGFTALVYDLVFFCGCDPIVVRGWRAQGVDTC